MLHCSNFNKLKQAFHIVGLVFLALALLERCSDHALIDRNMPIHDYRWSYENKLQVPVIIRDTSIAYNLYISLRHTNTYKYSNIFVLIHMHGPKNLSSVERSEFQLAYPDGQWLGSGSGNLYSYLLPYKTNYKFPFPGKYVFILEQNMRDNPLEEVSDIGLSIEPTKH